MNLSWLISHGVFPAIWKRLAENTTALLNGTNPQGVHIYNTFTSDSVYERGFARWASNIFEVGNEMVGGTLRGVRIIASTITLRAGGSDRVSVGSTSMVPSTDNTYSLGIGTNRFLRVYIGSTTVASLPAAASNTGARATVTDANATTFMSTVAGGGSNIVPVFCDGTNWKIG